ncbi:MAG: hypothetical protein K6F34_00700 [Lachnospiraceae bacterium]|nr:hypothetical protein [Lachnospiraceae bacterium]
MFGILKKTICLITVIIISVPVSGCRPDDRGNKDDAKAPVSDTAEERKEEPVITLEESSGKKEAEDPADITPSIIAGINGYEYKWDDLNEQRYVDTTGSATLILDKNGDLYYFGSESAAPVVIMKDVTDFSLEDDSDTLGYTAPVAVILTGNGDLYACGDLSYGTIADVNVLASKPEGESIPFLEPVLINKNVKDCRASWREIGYITGDDELYRSKNVYQMTGIEMDNPTPASEVEDIAGYFTEPQNYAYVLSDTVQMGCGRSFFISVLEDGSVWTCFLPGSKEDEQYAKGYGEVMGDGSKELISAKPVCIFPSGTCFDP